MSLHNFCKKVVGFCYTHNALMFVSLSIEFFLIMC